MNLSQASVAALAEHGQLARRIEAFVPRPGQQRLSQAVAQALLERRPLLAEVGTGTGKTFAYLVPVVLSELKTVISTGTHSLQDQLFQRDLPRVQAALGTSVRKALLKGRGNYLCHYRLQKQLIGASALTPAEKTQLNVLRTWSASTRSGDIAEVEGLAEHSRLLPLVTSTVDNCIGSDCPFYSDCFVLQARQQAQAADLIVVNHHLLLADIALKHDGFGDLLPQVDAYIVDEAHQIPELAGHFFGETFGTRHCQDLIRDCMSEAVTIPSAQVLVQPLLHEFDHQLRRLCAAMNGLPERGTRNQALATTAVAAGFSAVFAALGALCTTLDALRPASAGLSQCYSRADVLSQRLARWLEAAVDAAKPHHVEGQDDGVVWYALSPSGFSCQRTPLDVAPALQAEQQKTGAAWIFTSATLVIDGQFDQSAKRLGLEQPLTLAEPSPFQWRQQALCYLPIGLPNPSSQEFMSAFIATITPILHASHGRALLLFTAHRAMQEAAHMLRDSPWPLYVQGEAPRPVLIQQFRASGNGVLLGTASFREGIDIAGEALSVVVLDRLPFASPDDPVMQARSQAVRRQGGVPFRDVQLPQALMLFKQSVGRLLRRETDRGVIVICDPRIRTRSYGSAFLNVLPDLPLTADIEAVRAFFQNKPLRETIE